MVDVVLFYRRRIGATRVDVNLLRCATLVDGLAITLGDEEEVNRADGFVDGPLVGLISTGSVTASSENVSRYSGTRSVCSNYWARFKVLPKAAVDVIFFR